jgi:hypothetical protein
MQAKIEKAEVYGADATDGKWISFCDAHNQIANYKTKKSASKDTKDFCDCCAGSCNCALYFGEKHFNETVGA